MSKISTASTIVAWDFNVKIGKKKGSENCIGQCSRRRNDNGSKLGVFREMNNKVITNSCFRHPAKHKIWYQKRISPTTKIVSNTYNQIDYIILDQKQKQTLTDARSYGRTETSSYHRLVKARMEKTWPRLDHQRIPRSHQQKFDTKHLTQSKDDQGGYNEQIIQEIKNKLHAETTITNKWDLLKSIVKSAAESKVGYKRKEFSKYVSDPEIERMSKEQKDLRLQIEKCQDHELIKHLRNSRKKILK